MMLKFGRFSAVRTLFRMPLSESSILIAIILSRKFIHMGRIKINITKLRFFAALLLSIRASG